MLARVSQAQLPHELFSFDMEHFRLVLPASNWGQLALACMPPAGRTLLAQFHKDIEHVAHLLAALEPAIELAEPTKTILPTVCPTLPTIVITPCADAPRDMSCWVPIQDSAFGSQLTVPLRPSFNHSFPPMAAPSRRVPVKTWIWRNGHWQATVRGLEQRPRKLKHRKPRSKVP
ncbi:hypothetical protein C8F01DRAFT_1106993 [Mycena amicta]|nr:hypothetical protein C8F01DRAFT_1106993 [Mycena amicta]